MFIELGTALQMVNVSGKNLVLGRKNIRSIASYSSNNIFYFPMVVGDDNVPDTVRTHLKSYERTCAVFTMACISLVPFHRVNSADRGAIEDYLKIFHQNIGIDTPNNLADKVMSLVESAIPEEQVFAEIYRRSNSLNEYIKTISEEVISVNEVFTREHLTPEAKYFLNKFDSLYQQKLNEEFELNVEIPFRRDPLIDGGTASSQNHMPATYPREKVFTDLDMKKANDMMPTMFNANVGFIIQDTNETITKDIMVGVKAYVHRVPVSEMVSDLVNAVARKRKFLKFIKYVTGEEGTLADLVFGLKDLKIDATAEKKFGKSVVNQIKSRKRWADLSIPFLMKNYTPNACYLITTNTANFIKQEFGIDVYAQAKLIMEQNYLLAFMITDQTNEITYIMYDGHNYQFQEYSYVSLERESNNNDRALRELYRNVSSNRGGY